MSRKSLFFCYTKSYCTMKILLLLSFSMAAISLTRSSNSSEAHDITTLLNDTIAKTFENMHKVTVIKLVLSIENLKWFNFETYTDCELGPFKNEFYFSDVTVNPVKVGSARLRQEFFRNRMTIFFSYLSIEMEGFLGATPNCRGHEAAGFKGTLDFENITIYVIAQPMQNFSKNELYPHIDFIHYDGYESNYTHSPYFGEDLTSDAQYNLERRIKYFLPSLFLLNLRDNENFMKTLHAAFCRHPEPEITSHYPSSDIFKMKNYFFIPNFTSLGRILSNITITGMHNFHSHSSAENSDHTVSTLTIKDIQGTTNLHYDLRNFTIFPLYFEADRISITVNRKQQSINVTAHSYTVIDTIMNVLLTEYQSKWVMEGIQLAIASSIMPSMKYYRYSTQSTDSLEEHPIVKMITKLSQQFESRTIQKLYDTWNVTIPKSLEAKSSLQIESYNYNISIDAKPETALNPYPVLSHCNLYCNLEFVFEIPTWFGTISVLNTTHEFDEINFEIFSHYPTVGKSNNSNDFKLEYYSSFEVTLLSNPNNFTDHEQLEMEQKTQQLMFSLIKKTVIHFAEPLLSLQLDHYTKPVKIFDDFLPFYPDHELPFRVPDAIIAKHFMIPKINDVIITEWAKSPTGLVSIDQYSYLVNGSITTYVNLELAGAEIRMNFDDSLVPFDELRLTLDELSVRKYTNSGEVTVRLDSSYDSQNNKTISFSTSKFASIEMELESILGECFTYLTSIVF
ncbi:uncharacterized protein LOC135837321 [Planococcus citri]|uniref:uncharacterized protein LOC135837321 n=1 Tax=Planococcus citri TaxID=170843 RepID=UPI0031F906DF